MKRLLTKLLVKMAKRINEAEVRRLTNSLGGENSIQDNPEKVIAVLRDERTGEKHVTT